MSINKKNELKMSKKLKSLTKLFLSLFLVSAFVACDNDDDNNNDDNDTLKNTISAKWEIADSNSPYASFEFNTDGNYIVVENDMENVLKTKSNQKSENSVFKSGKISSMRSSKSESNLFPIHFGTYKIEGNTIILSGFGLIEVTSITSEEFTFSFTLESTGEKNSFVAGKSEEPISSSSRTDMLCRTWVLEKITEDGKIIEDEDDMIGSIVLFSKAGTYLVLYGGEGGEAGLSEWKWANSQETKLYYSWSNWEEDWSENIVTITDLKSTSLAIEEYGEIWHFTLKQ